MTLKIPEALRREMEEEARRQGVPKSVLVRACVEDALRRKRRGKSASCFDLVADLVGSQPGPMKSGTMTGQARASRTRWEKSSSLVMIAVPMASA